MADGIFTLRGRFNVVAAAMIAAIDQHVADAGGRR
jgi:hypothetical protein